MSMPFYASPEQIMADKAEFARKGISRGKSIIALEFDGGVLLVAENATSLSKVGENIRSHCLRGCRKIQRV